MDKLIDDLIKLAFAEDIGDGDHTTLCCIPETAMGKSQLIIKEDGVLAGVEMAKRIFHDFDPELKMTVFIQDGAEVKKGDIAFVVEGKIQSLLQTERLMLNVMQRMSGIATTTRKYCQGVGRHQDTRFGYSQDNSRYAYDRERGRTYRWRHEPSHRFVRYDLIER